MKKELKEQAGRLYERGLREFAHSSDPESRKLGAELLQEAWDLYREGGDDDRAQQIQDLMVGIYRSAAAKTAKSECREPVSEFNEWDLFLKIGCLGFGGPMAVFSLLENDLVAKRKLLTKEEFLEGAVLGDILPGPVTMDIVTYAGFKLQTWRGAVFSTLLFILPSFLIMLVLAMLYEKFSLTARVEVILKCLGAAVTGLILSVGLKLSKAEIVGSREVGILTWAFASSLIFRLDILVTVGIAGLIGIVLYHSDGDKDSDTNGGAKKKQRMTPRNDNVGAAADSRRDGDTC